MNTPQNIIQDTSTLSTARGAIDIICKYNGFFLSFALAVGAMSVGYQPIAGIIFLASLVILLSISDKKLKIILKTIITYIFFHIFLKLLKSYS